MNDKKYLILWLSVLNAKEAERRLKKRLVRFFLPYTILGPLLNIVDNPHDQAVRASDAVPDEVIYGFTIPTDHPMRKYVSICSGLVFEARYLPLLNLLRMPGFVTDLELNRLPR